MKLLPFDYAARNSGRTPIRTVLITAGTTGVIFLVLLMGAFVESLGSSLRGTGDPRNAIILGAGSEDFLEQSEIGTDVPTILASSVDGVADHHGQPMVSPEIHHAATAVFQDQDGGDPPVPKMVMIRGITPMAFFVHQQVYLRHGRAPATGEVLAGKLAATKLGLPETAVQPGKTLYFEGRSWKISGVFEAPGSAFESELWVPLEDLKVQTKRDSLTCVIARLTDPEQISEFDIFTKTRLDLELAVISEVSYYGALAAFYRPIQVMGWTMAALVVVSGLFGGLNTMIATIASRARELACLETLGYSRWAIVISLLQESLVQVGAGSLIASVLALVLLDGYGIRFTMGAITLQVSTTVLTIGFGAALFLAVAGTCIPAAKFARTPLVDSLRG